MSVTCLVGDFRIDVSVRNTYALQCQRILAIPAKRYQHRPVEFLTELEAKALINAPNTKTWIGRRDRTLLLGMF